MTTRTARLLSPAKINLDLRVLGRRPDGYHELRTVFQTVTLADTLDIEYRPSRRLDLRIDSSAPIEGNLIAQAAELLASETGLAGRWRVRLEKKIPMGAGLGGGSSNAAAALLALPVLAGSRPDLPTLIGLASRLGADVPFFLLGGTALGIGRGSEIYPLPDAPSHPALLVAPALHVSTAEAYRALGRELTPELPSSILNSFQGLVWLQQGCARPADWGGINDFEPVVFARHPELAALAGLLKSLGARFARMSGSGSSIFALFASARARDRALAALRKRLGDSGAALPIAFLGGKDYRAMWSRQLKQHSEGTAWPPRSRY